MIDREAIKRHVFRFLHCHANRPRHRRPNPPSAPRRLQHRKNFHRPHHAPVFRRFRHRRQSVGQRIGARHPHRARAGNLLAMLRRGAGRDVAHAPLMPGASPLNLIRYLLRAEPTRCLASSSWRLFLGEPIGSFLLPVTRSAAFMVSWPAVRGLREGRAGMGGMSAITAE